MQEMVMGMHRKSIAKSVIVEMAQLSPEEVEKLLRNDLFPKRKNQAKVA
jgi:hypothetical protein